MISTMSFFNFGSMMPLCYFRYSSVLCCVDWSKRKRFLPIFLSLLGSNIGHFQLIISNGSRFNCTMYDWMGKGRKRQEMQWILQELAHICLKATSQRALWAEQSLTRETKCVDILGICTGQGYDIYKHCCNPNFSFSGLLVARSHGRRHIAKPLKFFVLISIFSLL